MATRLTSKTVAQLARSKIPVRSGKAQNEDRGEAKQQAPV